jgi:hypothetical protein
MLPALGQKARSTVQPKGPAFTVGLDLATIAGLTARGGAAAQAPPRQAPPAGGEPPGRQERASTP